MQPFTSTNPDHVFEIYPVTRINDHSTVAGWLPIEGYDRKRPALVLEIHPVRSVQKLTDVIDPPFRGMDKATPALVAEFKTHVLDVWCFYAGQADDPVVQDEQDKPENDWDIHPDIDGCKGEEKAKDEDRIG